MSLTREQVFWAKVAKGPDCWQWTGSTAWNGYGRFRGRAAHRWAYEWRVGPIPKGLTIDHLCRNRSCVRPDHLQVVSMRINTLHEMRDWSPDRVALSAVHANEFTLADLAYLVAVAKAAVAWRETITGLRPPGYFEIPNEMDNLIAAIDDAGDA